MQLYDLAPQPVDPSTDPPVEVDSVIVRTFCVVWRAGGADSMVWKADVVSDTAAAAAEAVVYDQRLEWSQIVGIIDRSTLR